MLNIGVEKKITVQFVVEVSTNAHLSQELQKTLMDLVNKMYFYNDHPEKNRAYVTKKQVVSLHHRKQFNKRQVSFQTTHKSLKDEYGDIVASPRILARNNPKKNKIV